MRLNNKNSFATKQKINRKQILFVSALAYCIIALSFLKINTPLGPSDISISLTSGNSLVVDSNKGCAEEPHASYVSFEVCNTSTGDLNDLTVSLGNFTNSAFGLASGQGAIQQISSLPTGECKTIFWFIFYDCSTEGATSNLQVIVSDLAGSSLSKTDSLITVGTISSGAGGRIIGSSISPGQNQADSIDVNIEYSIGSIKAGSPLLLQPAGNLSFDASCYQLISSEVISSEVAEVQVGDLNRLYYPSLSKHTGNSHLMQLRYTFVVTCAAADTTNIRAFSTIYSGSNLKRYNVGDEELSSGATLSVAWQWLATSRNASFSELSWQVYGLSQGDLLSIERAEADAPFKTLNEFSIDELEINNPAFTFKDSLSENLANSTVYYRIKHIDAAAKVSYSRVQELKNTRDKIEMDVILYPNPAVQEIHIDLSGIEIPGNTDIKLYDMLGKLMFHESLKVQNLGIYTIDLGNYKNGKYMLMLESENHRMVKTIVKI